MRKLLKPAVATTALFAALNCSKPSKPAPEAPVAEAPAAPAEPVAPAPAAPASPPPDEDDGKDPLVWTVRSPDTHALLRQTKAENNLCRVSCTLDGHDEPNWSAKVECFGEGVDRRFVANDCERSVVIIAAPPRTLEWHRAVVMRVFKRGALDYQVTGIGVIPDKTRARASTSWVRGCFGVPGEPPRYTADGQAVEFQTIEGKTQTVPLIAPPPEPQAETPPPPPKPVKHSGAKKKKH